MTCVFLDNDDVKCWGLNSLGELGDGTTTSRSSPPSSGITFPSGETPVALSDSGAGRWHQCTLLDSGKVACWGGNFEGQLGDGTTTTSPGTTPALTASLGTGRTAVQVTTGLQFTCALLDDGTIKCWGENADGQLGDGTTTDRHSPTAVSTSYSFDTSLGSGSGSGSGSSSWDSDMDSNGDTHFVSSDGNDVTYGVYSGSSYSDVNIDSVTSGHSAIAVGLNGSIHMLYNTSSGLTYAVCHASCLTASNWADQVVTSSGTDVFDLVVDADMVPIVVASQGSTTMTYRLIDGTWESDQIFNFGSAHLSAAVHESGRLWVSSHLEFSGAPDDLYVFNKIGYAGTGINIDGDGDGWTGMDEIRCQTDRFDASSVPADFDGDGICDRFDSKNDLPRVGESSVITVGEDHACAILADSSVSCWGKNDVNQLGDSSTTGPKFAWAVSVDLPTDFEAIDIDAGQDHTCAVSRDGDVYCWGCLLYTSPSPRDRG